MKISHYKQETMQKVTEEGASGCSVRWVISEKDGASRFHMRVFEIEPGGHTPFHEHPWEHELFVLKGAGTLAHEAGEHPLREGDVIFISPTEKHQFKNSGREPLEIICLIPAQGACTR